MREAVLARTLARRLIEHEAGRMLASPGSDQAAWRVCEQLRGSLSKLVGVAGFRSLLARALTLTQRDAAWLARIEVKPDGTLAGLGVDAPGYDRESAAQAGLLLVTQLLALLHTFIGEALSLRLVRDIWPGAALDDLQTGTQEAPR